jgi:hypothetical protein
MIPKQKDSLKNKSAGPIQNTHVIRVSVLGLAGITVDRTKCRDKAMKASCPATPSRMKTVVAFSRNSIMKGITAQSKPLKPSPSDKVVIGQQGKVLDDETATNTTGSSDRPKRHVALWTSESSTSGSNVVFEASLQPIGNNRFAPIPFDITIALAENDGKDHKIALPVGVATLAISGDECQDGKEILLDLPVISLKAARPLSKSGSEKKLGGLNGYPMIAISPCPKDMETRPSKLQRLFRRNIKPKTPNDAARSAFAKAYSMDPNGDAVLRISLTVHEKGSKTLPMPPSTFLSANIASSETTNSHVSESDPDVSEDGDKLLESDGDSGIMSEDPTDGNAQDDMIDAESNLDDNDLDSTGSETFATNDDTLGFFTWTTGKNEDASVHDDDDSYTLSFEKKSIAEKRKEETDEAGLNSIEFDFFGRKVMIPMCGAAFSTTTNARTVNENESVVSEATKGRLEQMMHDFRDDLTYVTADLFGKAYSIPICSAVKDLTEDDITFYSENASFLEDDERRKYSCGDKVCRRPNPSREGDDKFSRVKAMKSKIVMNSEKIPSSDPILTTDDQKKNPENESDTSPKAIHELPITSEDQHPNKTSENPKGRPLPNFFSFPLGNKTRESSAGLNSQFKQRKVPPVIVPSDETSVGDLTANSHEMRIAMENHPALGSMNHSRMGGSRSNSIASRLKLSVPVAFGGNGMCFSEPQLSKSLAPVGRANGDNLDTSAIVIEEQLEENYFAEYDEYSIGAPRVRNPAHPSIGSTDDEAILSSKPIEMTTTGFHDEV